MSNVIELHPEESPLQSELPNSPAKIAKQWRRIGYQIRGRVSALLASNSGKKQLRKGTAERLRGEILNRCALLESEKLKYKDSPEELRDVIKAFGRKEGLFKNRNAGKNYKPYNETAIRTLMTTGSSPEEIRFIETFLEICGVKRETLHSIIIPQVFYHKYDQ